MSINIDDYRITLFLGVISVIGVSTYALRDNYLAMKRPKAKRRLKT